jgi:hypothetical protein
METVINKIRLNEDEAVELGLKKGQVIFEAEVDAPAGKVFSGTGTHFIREYAPTRPQLDKVLAALEASGFNACEDEECDYCHPV